MGFFRKDLLARKLLFCRYSALVWGFCFFFPEQVVIIFHMWGFHKHKLSGCYEVTEVVAGADSLRAPLVSCLLGLKEGWERKSGKGKTVKYAFSFFPSSL